MKRIILLTIQSLLAIYCLGQTRTIIGIVTDSDNQPLWEVKVWYSFDSVYAYTDIVGIYKISLPENIDTIYFSKPGYTPGKAFIGNRTEINITLAVEQVYELSFEDLLRTKVSTVSLREQNITEAPIVVTVITQDELRMLGIRTIKEALTLVPGYSLMQNDDEQIFSVRGIFATTNQKMLVMRDGHSLNEGNLDIPQTEYSLSIENIKKIEIIRGPGASIYGNSALASVINIITQDKENTSVKAGIGNYGQYNFDMYSCNRIGQKGSILIYGRYATTKGQEYQVTYQPKDKPLKGTYFTGQYPNNYDVGFRYRLNDFAISCASRRHQYNTFWTAQGHYTNIDNLLAPLGLQMNSQHVDVAYEPKLTKNLDLHFIHFLDYGKLDNNRLLDPIDSVKYIHGRIQLNEWNVSKTGINYYAAWNYSSKGQMLAGACLEQRNYLYSWLASNTNDSSKISYSDKLFYPKGEETRGALYVQAQQELTNWLRIDCGARYDIAQDFKSSFNPRIALIAAPMNALYLKIIYTKAFQAPGYSYRTSNADFSGSFSELEPERLTTYQGSIRYNYSNSSFIEATAYINRLNNLITRTDKNYYANYGKLGSHGLEIEMRQNLKPVSIFANYTLLLPDTTYMDDRFKSNNIYKNEFRHFPKHTANAGARYSYKYFAGISLYLQYASGFQSIMDKKVDNRLIWNSNIEMRVLKNFSLSLSIYNIMDKTYTLGDPSVIPIEQPGRWWMFSVLYSLK